MSLKVNYFAADKDESLIWKVAIKEEVCNSVYMQNSR